MIDFMVELGIVLIIAFLVGWSVSENYYRIKLLAHVKRQVAEAEAARSVGERLAIRVELIDGELFAYRAEDDVFLSKSHSGKALVSKLKTMFNDRRVDIVIHKDDGAEHIQEFF